MSHKKNKCIFSCDDLFSLKTSDAHCFVLSFWNISYCSLRSDLTFVIEKHVKTFTEEEKKLHMRTHSDSTHKNTFAHTSTNTWSSSTAISIPFLTLFGAQLASLFCLSISFSNCCVKLANRAALIDFLDHTYSTAPL